MKRVIVLLCVAGLLISLIGCAGTSRQYQNDVTANAITGAAIGGATGAIGGLIFGGGDNIWKAALGGATVGAYGGALGTAPRQNQRRRGQQEVIIVQPQPQFADIDCSAFETEEERQACERGRVKWLAKAKKERINRAYQYGKSGGY